MVNNMSQSLIFFIQQYPVRFSIMVYLLAIVILYVAKPTIMFTSQGNMKSFGTGSSSTKTIFPFWLAVLVCAVMAYFVVVVWQ